MSSREYQNEMIRQIYEFLLEHDGEVASRTFTIFFRRQTTLCRTAYRKSWFVRQQNKISCACSKASISTSIRTFSWKMSLRRYPSFMWLYAYPKAGSDANYTYEKPGDTRLSVNLKVPMILRELGYPTAIKPSTMQTIGASHSWPTLLGALTWMIEAVKASRFEFTSSTFQFVIGLMGATQLCGWSFLDDERGCLPSSLWTNSRGLVCYLVIKYFLFQMKNTLEGQAGQQLLLGGDDSSGTLKAVSCTIFVFIHWFIRIAGILERANVHLWCETFWVHSERIVILCRFRAKVYFRGRAGIVTEPSTRPLVQTATPKFRGQLAPGVSVGVP